MKKHLLVLSVLFVFGCAAPVSFLQNGKPSTINFKIDLTDPAQKTIADSIASKLISRFQVYSEERKDYTLVKPDEQSDYTLRIVINSFHLVPIDSQVAMKSKRDSIDRKYDSNNGTVSPDEIVKIAAANIITNVVTNALLNPLGFVAITVIKSDPDASRRLALDGTYLTAHVSMKSFILDSKGKQTFSTNDVQEFTLSYPASYKEQTDILSRNLILNLEGKLPFFKLLKI
jgi:hypothetical protein